jgi:cytochrome c oxidase assembly factor CtaG
MNTFPIAHPIAYILVKLSVLILALLVWWVVTAAPVT